MRMRRSPRFSIASITPISVMIPVNILDALARALEHVERVGTKSSLIDHAPAAMRQCQIGKADIAKPRLAAADQDRLPGDEQAVRQVRSQQTSCRSGPALSSRTAYRRGGNKCVR